MASSAQVSVTASATLLFTEETTDAAKQAAAGGGVAHGDELAVPGGPLLLEGTIGGYEIRIINQGAQSVFLGGPGVTPGTGYELKTATQPLSFDISESDEQLYAITAGSTVRVDVVAVGRGAANY